MGETHEVIATLTDKDGMAQNGTVIFFTVISGPNEGLNGTNSTNSTGQAVFSYTGSTNGTDTIQACYENSAEQRICSQTVTKVWNPLIIDPQPPHIDLTPPYDLNLVGQEHNATAAITNVSEDLPVTITVISGPNQGISTNATMNTNGTLSLVYNGTAGIGVDRIQACLVFEGQEICSDIVEKEWTIEVIELDPLLDTNPVETDHTVTATIKNLKNGDPIPDVLVSFEVKAGPNAGQTGQNATNGTGQASFTYTSNGDTGTDAIRACFTNAAQQQVCTDYGDTFDKDAIKHWEDDGPVCPAIKPNPAFLPDGRIGEPYSQTITGFGGSAPYTFEVTAGELPEELSLDPDTGLLSGTPIESGVFTFTITATDDNDCTGEREYTLTICPGIVLSPDTKTLPNGHVGVFYSQWITASAGSDASQLLGSNGGQGLYLYALTAGSLPDGLSPEQGPDGLRISGWPTTTGTWHFTITATDSAFPSCSASQDYAISIGEAPAQVPVPALSDWGVLMAVLLLPLAGYLALKRRSNRQNKTSSL